MEIQEKIKSEIATDKFYQDHFSNDGFRFVAWYVRRVLLQNTEATKMVVVDGANDKKIDALVIDDDNRNIIIIQGKFYQSGKIDSEPLNEILSAWVRLQDLHSLQNDGNNRLKERIEVLRQALEDEYNIVFELLTTGELTPSALSDFEAFSNKLEESKDFSASITLINSSVLEARLLDAEAKQFPMLNHVVNLDPDKVMVFNIQGTRSVVAAMPLLECLRFPGISDQKLFRKNVRQSLGWNTVNKRIKGSLKSERPQDFFFSHNGITAICSEFSLNEDKTQLSCKDLNVINGCQSLTTIYRCSEDVRKIPNDKGYILFRFYEVPQKDLVDKISINTNSQSAVKPRDLRSNDRVVLSMKRVYEAMFPDGLLLNQRGMEIPGSIDKSKVIDVGELAKMIMAWHCQRPNTSYNEKKLFDELYKNVFKTDYNPVSILALNTWGSLITETWNTLNLEDVLKASPAYVKYHLLYSISSLIAYANGQGDKVPFPSATLEIAKQHGKEILPFAVNCLNQALKSANQQAQVGGKIFSPHNWLKNNDSVNSQSLVASTMVGFMDGMSTLSGKNIKEILKVEADKFELRWKAE
ncbi:MAG: AIPR family protein [Prevotellaceae bacterium]|jgi:hypothetical protein|nr:AIPR family protein [Prevotellaceae bacterium]